jgi:hypothetical protein
VAGVPGYNGKRGRLAGEGQKPAPAIRAGAYEQYRFGFSPLVLVLLSTRNFGMTQPDNAQRDDLQPGIRHTTKPEAAAREAAKKVDVTILEMFRTMGDGEMVCVPEAEDETSQAECDALKPPAAGVRCWAEAHCLRASDILPFSSTHMSTALRSSSNGSAIDPTATFGHPMATAQSCHPVLLFLPLLVRTFALSESRLLIPVLRLLHQALEHDPSVTSAC